MMFRVDQENFTVWKMRRHKLRSPDYSDIESKAEESKMNCVKNEYSDEFLGRL